MDYKPESFKNVLSRQSFSCSKRLASLTPARNLSITTDQYGRAQVWLTVGKQSGPLANVVQASHAALGEDFAFNAVH
jgi:hypothetical protein